MKISNENSDSAVLKELGSRISRHRLNSNLTQGALAEEAGISKRTLARIEHGESGQTANLMRILRALRILENLETLIPEPAPSPIEQLKLGGKSRMRASARGSDSRPGAPWSWGGDE